MRHLSIAIVEDELPQAEALSKLLFDFAKEEDYELSLTHYQSAVEAAEGIKGQFDILFLDIQMPGMTGMQLAHEIRQMDPRVMIIFVTSLSQFAIEGYSVEAVDYLLKPLRAGEFRIKMKRAFAKLPEGNEDVMRFSSYGGIYVVPVNDILYCETSGHTVIYHTANGDYRKREPMKDTEKALANHSFIRINSCYLVAQKEIVGMEEHFVVLRNGERLLVSRPRLSSVLSLLKDKAGGE